MMNEDQQKAHYGIISAIETAMASDDTLNVKNRVALLTGAAGTGKTYTISHIVETLNAKHYKIGITSTTHKSVAVLRENGYDFAKTIHSHLGLKLQHDYDSGEQILVPDPSAKIEKVDVLIVDEYSMIDDNLMKHIHGFVRTGNAKFVLYVGDHYQLPPVNCDESPVSTFVKKENTFVLDKIVRQKEGCPIIDLATVFRNAIKNERYFDVGALFERIEGKWDNIKIYHSTSDWIDAYFQTPDNSYITSYTNKAVDNINKHVRDRLVTDVWGIPAPDYLIEGDRLVFTEMFDNGEKQFYNNQVVTVEDVNERLEDDLIVCEVFSDDGIFYTVHEESMQEYEKRLKKLAQKAKFAKGVERKEMWKQFFDLKERYAKIRYDYANTIHKTQGSTYDRIFINTADSLNKQRFIGSEMLFRLMYVAITRARNEVHINL